MRAAEQTAFSVVIPAHNEEQYIGSCLAAVKKAAEAVRPCRTEIIVVANRCTDRTAAIAAEYGANPKFDRMSPGIFCSTLYVAWNLLPVMLKEHAYLSGALFWFRKADFECAAGFDETLVSLEDMDFARRMNLLGKAEGKCWGTLKQSRPVTSSRKFDQFGDWYLIRNRKLTKQIFTGRDRKAADSFYYDMR